jgi:hypothetical protein
MLKDSRRGCRTSMRHTSSIATPNCATADKRPQARWQRALINEVMRDQCAFQVTTTNFKLKLHVHGA